MHRALAVVVVALALWLAPRVAGACDCKPRDVSPEGVRGRLAAADAVFEGRVLTRTVGWRWRDARGEPWNERVDRVVFAVHRVWRGELGRRVTIVTSRSDGTCGMRLPVGRHYLVFARRTPEGQLDVSSCSLTTALDNPDVEQIRVGLGDGGPPAVGARGCAIEQGGVLDLLVALGLLARARRRRQTRVHNVLKDRSIGCASWRYSTGTKPAHASATAGTASNRNSS